ncbi:hypothetical protein M8J77_010439 [Diaphorina citri]|nr:hypothetical protein M8J77_011896 [Diaphorina citri]KAI5696755.1 hypothetical protein M8J77_010439 [Diaphorina citri]
MENGNSWRVIVSEESDSDTYKTLGLVIRHSNIFVNIDTIRLLFTSLVRSQLEYASVIWAPKSELYNSILEKIQARFVRALFKRENGFYPTYPNAISYKQLAENLDLESLKSRREYNYLMLLYNIMNNKIDIPSAMDYISIRVPIIGLRQREDPLFFSPGEAHQSPTYRDSTLPTAMALFNKHNSALDFADKENIFKQKCKSFLYHT